MVSNKMMEGVGKKIVEALKKQSDIEIQNVVENPALEEEVDYTPQQVEYVSEPEEEVQVEETSYGQTVMEPMYQNITPQAVYENIKNQNINFEQTINPSAINFSQPTQQRQPEIINNDLEGFEIPTNVAVLKQLITQLPTGVTKQTGALIIKQTMEALGISMKSVLQEAQQVQENLSHSSRDCQATIMEYKRQINVLDKQAQKFQRQYSSLNDIISLFIQTNN